MVKGAKGEEIAEPDDIDKRIILINEKLKNLKQEEIQLRKSDEVIRSLFKNNIYLLVKGAFEKVMKLKELFLESEIYYFINGGGRSLDNIEVLLENIEQGLENTNNIRDFKLEANMLGLKRAGLKAYNSVVSFSIEFKDLKYVLYLNNRKESVFEKLYHQKFVKEEIEAVVDRMMNDSLNNIEDFLKSIDMKPK